MNIFHAIPSHATKSLAALLLLAVAATGCSSSRPRCLVSISNVSDNDLKSVAVQSPKDGKLSFIDVAANSSADALLSTAGMHKITKVTITPKNGVPEHVKIDLGKAVPQNFRGRVVFQIEEYNRVRAFVMPDTTDNDDGDLPWDTPPSWVGAPTLPGMSGEE